mmetsp:Transcript_74589/g.187815  ORF Transcript_74589/g.187815 Transcript_74589/m.187815 type:complete len:215 (+) Transcript_74589:1159-1803(+)
MLPPKCCPDSARLMASMLFRGIVCNPKKLASPCEGSVGSTPLNLATSLDNKLFSVRRRWNSVATTAGPKLLSKPAASIMVWKAASSPENSSPSEIEAGAPANCWWNLVKASWNLFWVACEALWRCVRFSTCRKLFLSCTRLAALKRSFFSCFSSSCFLLCISSIRRCASSYRRSQAFFFLFFRGGNAVILTSRMTSANASSPPYFLILSSNNRH